MKLEDINPMRKGLEEKFIGSDGVLRVVFTDKEHGFMQYRVVDEGVYIFDKYVDINGNQLRFEY